MVVVARGGAAGAAEVAKGARYIQVIFHQLYTRKARSTERTMGERDKTQISNPNQFSRRLGFGKHVRTEGCIRQASWIPGSLQCMRGVGPPRCGVPIVLPGLLCGAAV